MSKEKDQNDKYFLVKQVMSILNEPNDTSRCNIIYELINNCKNSNTNSVSSGMMQSMCEYILSVHSDCITDECALELELLQNESLVKLGEREYVYYEQLLLEMKYNTQILSDVYIHLRFLSLSLSTSITEEALSFRFNQFEECIQKLQEKQTDSNSYQNEQIQVQYNNEIVEGYMRYIQSIMRLGCTQEKWTNLRLPQLLKSSDIDQHLITVIIKWLIQSQQIETFFRFFKEQEEQEYKSSKKYKSKRQEEQISKTNIVNYEEVSQIHSQQSQPSYLSENQFNNFQIIFYLLKQKLKESQLLKEEGQADEQMPKVYLFLQPLMKSLQKYDNLREEAIQSGMIEQCKNNNNKEQGQILNEAVYKYLSSLNQQQYQLSQDVCSKNEKALSNLEKQLQENQEKNQEEQQQYLQQEIQDYEDREYLNLDFMKLSGDYESNEKLLSRTIARNKWNENIQTFLQQNLENIQDANEVIPIPTSDDLEIIDKNTNEGIINIDLVSYSRYINLTRAHSLYLLYNGKYELALEKCREALCFIQFYNFKEQKPNTKMYDFLPFLRLQQELALYLSLRTLSTKSRLAANDILGIEDD